MNQELPISEKYTLTIKEAADYFSIGVKSMRRLAEDHLGMFSSYNGNRYLIIRSEFEEYLRKTPILPNVEGEEMKRAKLEDKSIFNPEETVLFYDLSHRKFKRLIDMDDELPFVALFRTRKIILRKEFEKYMEENPEIMEGLKSANVLSKKD